MVGLQRPSKISWSSGTEKFYQGKNFEMCAHKAVFKKSENLYYDLCMNVIYFS